MKLRYDKDVDILRVLLNNKPIQESDEVSAASKGGGKPRPYPDAPPLRLNGPSPSLRNV